MSVTSESLNPRYANSVLIRLLNGSCLKTALQSIVKNLYSLDKLLKELESDGLIVMDKKPFGKNIQEVSLTQKGRFVAQKLKDATEITEGIIQLGKLPDKSFFSPLQRAIMYIGDEGKAILSKIREETGCSSDDLRSLEDMGFITQKIENVRGSPENFIVLTPKGIRAERKLLEFAEEPRNIEDEKLSHESKR